MKGDLDGRIHFSNAGMALVIAMGGTGSSSWSSDRRFDGFGSHH